MYVYVDLEISERETKLAGDLHDVVVEVKSYKVHELVHNREPGNIVRRKYGAPDPPRALLYEAIQSIHK